MSEPEDFDNGWDTSAILVDGRWVDRSPRRPEAEPQVRREVALMPWLAPQLPLPVPSPWIVSEEPLVVRHAYLPGAACPGTSAAQGAAVGRFLTALHAVDPAGALDHGVLGSEEAFAAAQAVRDRMAVEVLPKLPRRLRGQGAALLDRMAVRPPHPCVVHGDLGPAHLRVVGDEVTGVIDWGDCHLGDPGLDLAWTTKGAAPAFVEAVEATYQPDEALTARARDWHLLGPWHEVLYGLDTDQDAFVGSGLAGVASRLELWEG